ncbi:hypothetical protein GYMLUDRAFT_494357 [Collybiopsis luxurians FD-317 M1]|uniref:Uncharacterized protein n=1 Tax=Collybiopsis luxurians FD-317 M1 TaxID=944289 RepID=A0A0D0BX97_9AGAR|nr:hypothetical protein GYMLUDRAFT_494357 [Collybiopsis luxurians FD-317 M1]
MFLANSSIQIYDLVFDEQSVTQDTHLFALNWDVLAVFFSFSVNFVTTALIIWKAW